MKKFLALMLAMLMALSLVACGGGNNAADDNNANGDAANTDESLVVLENVVDWGETEPYRVLVQKGDPKGLLEGINKAIAELTANDGALIKEIENKVASQETYTPDAVASDLAPADDAAASSDKPVLVLGTSPDYPPYEFFADAAMTEYAGIDVEVAQAIADKLGMELEVTDIAFDSIIPGVQTGKYDMGMAGMTVTDERKEQVNFSDSYATGVQVVIVKDDSPITSVDDLFADGASTVVGTQAGTTGFIYATSDIEDAGLGTVKSFGKTTDAVEALKNGDNDIAEMRKAYNQRRRFLMNAFREMGLECFEPFGAFYVFPSIKQFGMTSEEFATRLLNEEKVAVVPGTAFGECGEGFLRISYAYSLEDLKEAIGRLERFIGRLRNERK